MEWILTKEGRKLALHLRRLDKNITYDFLDTEIPDFDPEFFDLWLSDVVDSYGGTIEALSFVFCSDEELKAINKEHLNHDYYTDIITFDYNDGLSLNAEMFVSVDRIKENAREYGNGSMEDELCRVMVHGVLHCLGYKDKTEQEAQEMRRQEELCLERRNSFT